MSNLKLEVGKEYLTRDGRVVRIVSHDKDDPGGYCYADEKGDWWLSDGRFISSLHDHRRDLIAEAPALIAPAVGVSDAVRDAVALALESAHLSGRHGQSFDKYEAADELLAHINARSTK